MFFISRWFRAHDIVSRSVIFEIDVEDGSDGGIECRDRVVEDEEDDEDEDEKEEEEAEEEDEKEEEEEEEDEDDDDAERVVG